MGNINLDDYRTVPERIADFAAKHPDGCLRPLAHDRPYWLEVIDGATFIVYAAAAYRDPEDRLPGVGVAWEPFPGKTPYTRDSELQNAETSAWGRAIVAVLASDTKKGIASAEDVLHRQDPANDDPRDWYQQNGWADKAEHTAYQMPIIDLLSRATPAEQAAFKTWRESEGIPSFRLSHTKDQAALVSANILEIVKDPEAKPETEKAPPDEPETPTPPRRAKPADQRIAQRARELGLSAQERADVVHAVTQGRTRTGKDLAADEVLRVEESLIALAAHTLEFSYDPIGNPSLVETVPASLLGAE